MSMATKRKHRLDETAPADRSFTYDEEARPKPSPDASYRPSPWFRFFASDWLAATRRLRPAEIGILSLLLAMMHEEGKPLEEDHVRLARSCGTTKATFKCVLEGLITAGEVYRTGGKLWCKKIQDEMEYRRSKSKNAIQNVTKRWEKTEENQSRRDTTAYRDQRSEVRVPEDGGHTASHPSASLSDSADTRLRGASAFKHRANDTITVESYGVCRIVRIDEGSDGNSLLVTPVAGERQPNLHVPTDEDGDIIHAKVREWTEEEYANEIPF